MSGEIRILDKIESEAVELLDNFKQSPIKTVVVSFIVLWVCRKLYGIMRDA